MLRKTLRVQFPDTWPGWDVPELVLHGLSQSSQVRDSLVSVSIDADIPSSDYNSDATVFFGCLSSELASLFPFRGHGLGGGSNHQSFTAVAAQRLALKFAFRADLIEELEFEAAVYERALPELQGEVVPMCFGFYKGEDRDDRPIGCLVLQQWGEGLRTSFQKLSIDRKMRILNCLALIHKHGRILHGDFAERNVLISDDDVRLIDFDQAEEHCCECDYESIEPGVKPPSMETFGCDYLWSVCKDTMQIWREDN